MNRSLTNVLFGGLSTPNQAQEYKPEGEVTQTSVDDLADAMLNAESVILVVGYGMAVAKTQYAISSIVSQLRAVPYDIVLEMDEINDDFPDTDLTVVIGANDTVNPIAMEKADVPNPMFYMSNPKMLFCDAKTSCEALKTAIEAK
ncbi:hypothetical protein E4U61_002392 [Claviceps capensis]|nr:hypothetical protein E4U61_002392 [Claviceps capensis]